MLLIRASNLHRLALAILAIGLLLSGLFTWQAEQAARATDRLRFERFGERLQANVARRMLQFEYGLRGASALWPASTSVERREFIAMARDHDMSEEFPGALGLGFIRRVPRTQLEDFLAATRADQAPNFTLKSRGDAPALYVIEYIEPLAGNLAAEGLDIGQDPKCRAAAERAMFSGRAAITAPLLLAQGPQEGASFLIFYPVYQTGSEPTTPEERAAHLIGWTYMPIVATKTFADIAQQIGGEIDFDIIHGSLQQQSGLIFDADRHLAKHSGPINAAAFEDREFHDFTVFGISGETWTLAFSSNEYFIRASRSGIYSSAIGGPVIALLLYGLILTFSRTTQRAQDLATSMTVELSSAVRKAEFLALVATRTTNAVVFTDDQQRITWVNEGFTRITGYTREDALGQQPGRLLQSPLTNPNTRTAMRAALLRGDGFRGEVLNRQKNGKDYWVDLDIVPLSDATGTVTGFISMQLDITERKTTEAQLKEQAERTALALAALNRTGRLARVGAWEFDIATQAITWSEQVREIHEVPADYVPGLSSALDFYPGSAREDILRVFQNAVDHGTPYDIELPFVTAKGNPRWVRALGEAYRPHGTTLAVRGAFQDVTESRRQLEALAAAKEIAEEASRSKAEFLANMSHEIRTPMNAVIGMTELLLDSPLNPVQHEFADTIHHSGNSLLALINDILDFSKIESGHLELERAPFNLRDEIENALDLAAQPAAAKELDLIHDIEEEVPVMLIGDVTRLRQILINLVSNAVKFTERGEVLVTVSYGSPRGGGAPQLHVSVKDSGIGIQPDQLDRLFKSFSQVDASITRKYGGTGLGLAICHRLVELMGGRIWVETAAGQGSEFQFEIPMESADASATTAPTFAGQRVLLVDDNASQLRTLARQFQHWGLATTCASSGPEALALLDGATFDAAIIDSQMPGMDGCQLAAAIRLRLTAIQLPLLAIAPLGADAQRFAGLDVAAVLTKPVRTAALLGAVGQLFGTAPPTPLIPAVAETDPLGDHRPLRILLAEDNPVNQRVARLLLDRLGYECAVAHNGREALAAVARQPFDVILLDVQMPELDGLETARQLCTDYPPAVRPWMIAMTANAMEGDREACIAAGMDDYLAKPISTKSTTLALTHAARQLELRR